MQCYQEKCARDAVFISVVMDVKKWEYPCTARKIVLNTEVLAIVKFVIIKNKMTIETIAEDLKNDSQLAPHELARVRGWLAGEYAFLNARLVEVLNQKPSAWNSIRKETKSDTAAERIWQQSDLGKDETIYRLKLKSIEKLSSAIKTKLEVMQGEARNQY